MQQRWILDLKDRMEHERTKRLAKLDELSADVKRLEHVVLDNATHLDESTHLNDLWAALRALATAAVDSPVRKPFRQELSTLREISAAKGDPVIAAALASLDRSDVPDIGVEPLGDLTTWFVTSVAPHVSEVALVPDENAGVLSHLASHLLSSLRFQRHGLVPGSDVLSVLARAEYYLNAKDLDSAARELNQLKGPAKLLLGDWLEAARRRLEVQNAVQVSTACGPPTRTLSLRKVTRLSNNKLLSLHSVNQSLHPNT
jgi:mitofilin